MPAHSLGALVSSYEQANDELACIALLRPPFQFDGSGYARKERLLLNRQQRVLEQMAKLEIETDEDLIAMLKVWQTETVESNDQIDVTERLVLSVLRALQIRA